jgi:hypothetical protein
MERRVRVAGLEEELLEMGRDLGTFLPLISKDRERFVEREFQELIQTASVGV